MQEPYHIELDNAIPQGSETILFNGINEESFQKKGLNPIRSFSLFIKDNDQNILGGATGVTYYGCLYIDMLWIDLKLRHQGYGTKLMHAAESIGKERSCSFATVNTMDFEGLPFYKKLGYSIEFIRDGYEKSSKMFLLRKKL